MLDLISRFSGDLPRGLQTLADTSPTMARVLAGRGILSMQDLAMETRFLLPASDLLGLDRAVALLNEALIEQKRILIVGDFDCDGATSTALMVRALSAMGGRVDFLVPDRFKFGYGLTPPIVALGVERFHPDLIVTVDNGISSHDGVLAARDLGIDVIITDHHLTNQPNPQANAVVNPNQLDCQFASKALVGVGVAFYVLGRLAKIRREAGLSSVQITKFLDLVALGTIADVGVLDHNNRILVYHGLKLIQSTQCCLGILALLERAGRDPTQIQAQDLGFALAPLINAAGRIDHMQVGIECLLADDWQNAQDLAQQLYQLNQERRFLNQKMQQEAHHILQNLSDNPDNQNQSLKLDLSHPITPNNHTQQNNSIQQRSIILYQDDWHQGVIGIVAGRLKDHFYRPSLVFAPADPNKTAENDLIKGSARSIQGIHIRDTIEAITQDHPDLIYYFGGHAMAAGLTLPKSHLPDFIHAFNQQMDRLDNQIFLPTHYTDGKLQPQEFSLAFAEALQSLSIWGNGFAPPIFEGIFTIINNQILKDKHLKLTLRYPQVTYPIEAIWFNYDPQKWDWRAEKVHLSFELSINQWQNQKRLQLIIKDLAVIEVQP